MGNPSLDCEQKYRDLVEQLSKYPPGTKISLGVDELSCILQKCVETSLGDPQGAQRQFRCPAIPTDKEPAVHIRDYGDKLLAEIDCKDPRVDPIGHLFCDVVGINCECNILATNLKR